MKHIILEEYTMNHWMTGMLCVRIQHLCRDDQTKKHIHSVTTHVPNGLANALQNNVDIVERLIQNSLKTLISNGMHT